jgi:hypothetical protein
VGDGKGETETGAVASIDAGASGRAAVGDGVAKEVASTTRWVAVGRPAGVSTLLPAPPVGGTPDELHAAETTAAAVSDTATAITPGNDTSRW